MNNNKQYRKYNVIVKSRPNERIDVLISRFKRKMNDSGVLELYKSIQTYEKPSVTKRRKKQKGIYESRKKSANSY